MSEIFVPAEKQDAHIAEFDVDTILEQAAPNTKIVEFNVDGTKYSVNLGTDRYRVFVNNRSCKCCGIVGNRMFLDADTQNNSWHFNLYAESGDKDSSNKHMILMCKDHIKPVSEGGLDEMSNYQTLCFNCNSAKATGLSIEQIKSCMFVMYRIFKSSYSRSKTKEKIKPVKHIANSSRNGVIEIKRAIDENLVEESKKQQLNDKIVALNEKAANLEKKISLILLDAQITGRIPDDSVLKELT